MKDIVRTVSSSKLTQTTSINKDTDRTGALDMMRGATGPVMKAISKRRSHRQQWRIFECIAMILLDGTLIAAAFSLAYYVRFYILGNSSFVTAIHNNLNGNSLPTAGSFKLT